MRFVGVLGWRAVSAIPGGVALVAMLTAPSLAPAGPVDPSEHWPLPPAELERRLAEDPIEIVEVTGGVGGVMGVKKLTLRLGDHPAPLWVKWKPAPRGDADGWNNTPRKEMAAYAIQKWFLDPDNYVVPTTITRCIDFETYAPVSATAGANLAGASCVAGALSVWITNITLPNPLYDEARFAADPHYARHMADFNVLTYLIEHEDGRTGNFLVAKHEEERRVFSVDNGVAFGAWVKNWFVPNWHKIRVPKIRAETVERLRAVGEEELAALGVLAELEADADGVLRAKALGQNADPDDGSRTRPGWIQLGLNEDEIEDVAERLRDLLERVDDGEISVY